jgi:radical SAM protein with 4Fe4S-binding SPASM domain
MAQDKKDTYCPLLWSEAFIDPKGDVYSCCHRKPAVLGNIHTQKLEDICNGPAIREMRQKSLDGELECFERCSLIDKKAKRNVPADTTFKYAGMRKLKIEFGELCNISCVMCWQDHKSKAHVDYEKMVEHVDLKPFKTINIQGGEPLAIAAAKKYYDYVASENKQPLLMTNGLLITDEWAEKIARHSAYIYISLNAATASTHETVNRGSKWDVVLKNIQKLRTARERLGTDLKILGHMTIIIENIHEVPLFIRDFLKFGVDTIDFGFDSRVPAYINENPFLRVTLKKDIYRALKGVQDISVVDLKRIRMLGLLAKELP